MKRVILAALVPLALAACQPAAPADKKAPTEPAAPADPAPPADPAQPAAPAAPAEVPVQYRGEWGHDLKACGTGTNDSRLIIEASKLTFWESVGEVTDVTLSGRTVSIATEMSGEGERWKGLHEFRLSEDGKSLTDVTDGESFVRYRCP